MFEEAIKALHGYKTLEPNWDGYGGNIPEARCMDKAIEFLEAIAASNLPLRSPKTSLSTHSAEVYWARTGSLMSVSFEVEDGELEIIATFPDGQIKIDNFAV